MSFPRFLTQIQLLYLDFLFLTVSVFKICVFTLMKEKEEDTNERKVIPCSWEELKLLKMCILPKVVYGFGAIPIDTPMEFCTEVEKQS